MVHGAVTRRQTDTGLSVKLVVDIYIPTYKTIPPRERAAGRCDLLASQQNRRRPQCVRLFSSFTFRVLCLFATNYRRMFSLNRGTKAPASFPSCSIIGAASPVKEERQIDYSGLFSAPGEGSTA